MDLNERIQIAFKKLKGAVYFDKTQLPLRDKIVAFEDSKIDRKLEDIASALQARSDTQWEEFEDTILKSIGAFVLPKSLKSISDDTVIFNSDRIPIELEKAQYFLDLSVTGHILGVLWILSVGRRLDGNNNEDNAEGMYEHSYGNRLRKTLLSETTNDITYSPGLFEPYFSQYERWRDYALEQAESRLKDNQDSLILTLDFKSFYYSVDLREEDFDSFVERLPEKENTLWQRRVNKFVYKVICKYSYLLEKVSTDEELKIGCKHILPIGFLPSGILANWVLTPFDNAIIERWNPTYYGRYVDDIIIVDKVEKNSPLYRKVRERNGQDRLCSSDIIKMFLLGEAGKLESVEANRGILNTTETLSDSFTDQRECSDKNSKNSKNPVYFINPLILNSSFNHISVQDRKVKVFYFQSGATKALISCFKSEIAQNVSEFRLMPDIDNILCMQNYSEIFNLKNEEGLNKFRGISGLEIDKFALSKFLGKYRTVSGLISSKEEDAFERDLMLIFDERILVENYAVWERLFEILLVNDRFDLYEKMAKKIVDAIDRYKVSETKVDTSAIFTHDGLLRFLHAALCRTSAIVRGKKIDDAIGRIGEKIRKIKSVGRFSMEALSNFGGDMHLERIAYRQTRMVNKYLMPLLLDCLSLNTDSVEEVRLYNLTNARICIDKNWGKSQNYRHYPYIVSPQEISFALTCTSLAALEAGIDPQAQTTEINKLFFEMNYPNVSPKEREINHTRKVAVAQLSEFCSKTSFAVHINNSKRDKLCVAVGNASVKETDFISAMEGNPNRTYNRYRAFSEIFDQAIKANVDLLVLPENYLPFEWLPTVSRLCANNQMALVTGIEHCLYRPPNENEPKYAYNLTAIILPYEDEEYKFAHISYHNKVCYSPEEKRYIEGYHHKYKEGEFYQLFSWHDVWFPVYCCFELASIQDRSLFQSYADLVVAVEWNKDISYFSSIIESLCRDLHCYCVQANSSEPGDSRVLSPSSSNQRDIIKTKGGKNSCILATDINIKLLRDFQAKNHYLQRDDKTFKPSPPRFDNQILQHKRNGTLWNKIHGDNKC